MSRADRAHAAVMRILRTACIAFTAAAVSLFFYLVPFRALLPAAALPSREEGEMRLHFLSVGQGARVHYAVFGYRCQWQEGALGLAQRRNSAFVVLFTFCLASLLQRNKCGAACIQIAHRRRGGKRVFWGRSPSVAAGGASTLAPTVRLGYNIPYGTLHLL